MAISDEQVAVMRALLAGDIAEYQRLIADLENVDRWDGYERLLSAAFLEAADRRFGTDFTGADIIGYVADVRIRFNETGAEFDPRAAEQLIRAVLGDGSIEGLADRTIAEIQILVLADLVATKLSDAELEEFLTDVRALADESLRLDKGDQRPA